MALGDLLFIAAFIVLPIMIIVWAVRAFRTIGRRPYRTGSLTETTQELAEVEAPPRDWAASIQPLRGRGLAESQASITERPPFRIPSHRARSGGVVSRLSPPSRRGSRQPRTPRTYSLRSPRFGARDSGGTS